MSAWITQWKGSKNGVTVKLSISTSNRFWGTPGRGSVKSQRGNCEVERNDSKICLTYPSFETVIQDTTYVGIFLGVFEVLSFQRALDLILHKEESLAHETNSNRVKGRVFAVELCYLRVFSFYEVNLVVQIVFLESGQTERKLLASLWIA